MSKSKFKIGDKVMMTNNSRSYLNLKKGDKGVIVDVSYINIFKRTAYFVSFENRDALVMLWHYSGLTKIND